MIKVYGSSDDNINIDGEIDDSIGDFGTDERPHGHLLIFSDGTHVEVKYGKNHLGIWEVKVLREGSLFDRVEPCFDEDASPYSDILYLKDGVQYFFHASEWGVIRRMAGTQRPA